MGLNDSEIEGFDVEALLNFAEWLIFRAERLWSEASFDQKQRLQQVFFPEGMTFLNGDFEAQHNLFNLQSVTSCGSRIVRCGYSLGNIPNVKQNLSATSTPTVNDDSSQGYVVGSRWIDSKHNKEYVCSNESVGATVWLETTSSGTSDAFLNPFLKMRAT